MKSLAYIAILSLFLVLPLSSTPQCKNFAKKVCRLELNPYIHDGNYNAAILTEGEDAELFKTFYAGQEYRIAVCGSESLPKIEFKVLDVERKVLFTNADKNFTTYWDFEVEATQQLIIIVKVKNAENSTSEQPLTGCVSIMFGLKAD